MTSHTQTDLTWQTLQAEVRAWAHQEPTLTAYLHNTVLRHPRLDDSLSYLLASKLASAELPALSVRDIVSHALRQAPKITEATRHDLLAIHERDPAAAGLANPYLHHKGFHAVQGYRIASWYWHEDRKPLARYLQSRISEIFAVDIHPAARLGSGLFFDHGTGIVIGETAVVGDNVSLLQGVTLGGTGKGRGDRHPKIASGVLISAGAKVLGNIRVGTGAKIGAGSVVLSDVPPNRTVVGIPARVVLPRDALVSNPSAWLMPASPTLAHQKKTAQTEV